MPAHRGRHSGRNSYELTLQDLLTNARFPDVVGLNCRALDRYKLGEVFQLELLLGNHDNHIRSLIPQYVNSLLVAGRCISCDHESQTSLRGAATCLTTGHAAGAAAALASKCSGEVRQVSVPMLQQLLQSLSAILKTP